MRVQLCMLLAKLPGLRELCMDANSIVPAALSSLKQRCPHVAFLQPQSGTALRAADCTLPVVASN